MLKRWILYLAAVSGCFVFFLAYRQWFAWFALICVLCLPIVALLTSLPAMIKLKISSAYPVSVPVGTEQRVKFYADCRLPAPPYKCVLKVTNQLTGETRTIKKGIKKRKNGLEFPTENCGKLLCKPKTARVYDYLGLFWIRIRKKTITNLTVRPIPVPITHVPDLERFVAVSWQPKPGGGFSENHEMRQYVPGDKMNQVHWKLTAKTGDIIVREPMEPTKTRFLVEMEIRGTPEELNTKFGQLLWLSDHLLNMGMRHELRVLTGSGIQSLVIESSEDLEAALDTLLGQSAATEDAKMESATAAWCYRIGGGEDAP